ncbi:MAG TPA: adenylate/guanylate cyclase domain-containing protein [Actinomycetota bacterium]|nr:adenylate/guanylate cyclase domain-containing protein [Actinomycetota bacterium]
MAACPRCQNENPQGARFCSACGARLDTPAGGAREERKVVTVLFADLVDFTSRSERMDPEDVRAMLTPYYARLRTELEHFGGTVEKFIGDAVVALFGAPVAHEDDPERAVRAGLAIREAIREMNEENSELDLHVRIGVNTGEALVSLAARTSEGEGMAAGDVVNTAARLQSAAPVDGVMVGEATHRATANLFDFEDAEPVQAKGKARPIQAWLAIEARSRFGVDVTRTARTELVGRERELALLADALARTRAERSPQLVTLVGEPGIGKSRLVFELLKVVDADAELIIWRQGRCLPYGEGVSFWALGEMVKAQAGILETDRDQAAEAKLRSTVADLIEDPDEAAWIEGHLRPLVGLGAAELREDRQADAFAAWRRFLEGMGESNPSVLVFEDLHWADEGLLDFIDHLIDWATGVPLLVLCTARPELLSRRPGWGGGKANAVTVSLSPLSDESTARLIGQLLERSVLPAEVQTVLLGRSGGNPLYAEEFARMAAERELRGDLDTLPVPDTIQGLIAARLDSLSADDKALLQDGAVVGKVFWLGALTAIGGLDATEAAARLHALERRQLVRRDRKSSVAGETEYAFWHGLVRDVAYQQIPRALRADKHRRAAEWISRLAPDRAEDRSEMLAHHYLSALEFARASGQDIAGMEEPARLALRTAGDRAFALNAFRAAASFFHAAADLWPETDPERGLVLLRYGRSLWLSAVAGEDVLTRARVALLASGYKDAAAEAEIMLGDAIWQQGRRDEAFHHFSRARSLVEDRPPTPSTAWVLAHVSRFMMLAAQHDEAIRLGRQALAMAEDLELPDLRAHALNNIGTTRTASGDRGGIADLEASISIAEDANSPYDISRGYLNLASVTFMLGDLRRAGHLHAKGLQVAERYGLGEGIRWLRAERAFDLYYEGRWEEALREAQDFIEVTAAEQPHYMEQQCRLVRAAILMARGESERATTDSAWAVEASRRAKDPQAVYPAFGEHARMLHLAGRAAEAEAVIAELLAIVAAEGRDLTWSAWFLPVAHAAVPERVPELLSLADKAVPTPWIDAGRAVLQRDLASAADTLGSMGARPEEAFARLRAGQRMVAEGRTNEAEAQLTRALDFYRAVEGTAFAREAESLLRSTA